MIEWMHNEEVTRYLKLHGATAFLRYYKLYRKRKGWPQIYIELLLIKTIYLGTVSLKNIDLIKKKLICYRYASGRNRTGASKAGTGQSC